jgi:Xaa-Pro aminopeptidase
MTTDFAYYQRRLDRLAAQLPEAGVDGFLISHPVNVSYLTGFSGDSSYLLVGRQRLLLVSDGRFTQQLQEECPEVPVHIRPPSVRITDAAVECVNKLGWRSVGFEAARVSVEEFERMRELAPSVTWKACKNLVEMLRLCKDADEIQEIRQAVIMAERAFEQFRLTLGREDSEKSLADRMEMLVRAEGATSTSFPPILAIAERSALPHCPPSTRKLDDAELLLVDWGACGRHYRSDLTRVLANRTISPQLREVWSAVLNAQQRAIEVLRPGIEAQAVDAAARAVLSEAGFGNYFNHALGHGIGREVHESPRLGAGITTVLQPGMVVTIEPGVYIPGWGGVRIEDDVLITEDGCEVLSRLGRTPDELVVAW